MPNLTGRQVAAILLRRAGQGLGQYFEQKQLAEQEELRRKDRERVDILFKQGQADRQRKLGAIRQEGQDQAYLNSLLRQLDAPFGMSIPFPGGGGGVEVTRPPSDLPEFSGLYSDVASLYRKLGKELPAHLRGKPTPTAGELVKTQRARETARLDLAAKRKAARAPTKDTRGVEQRAIDNYIALTLKGQESWTPEDKLLYEVSKPRAIKEVKKQNPIRMQSDVLRVLEAQHQPGMWDVKPMAEKQAMANAVGRAMFPEDWIDLGSPSLRYWNAE